MELYVAGKFSDKKQIKEYMNELVKLGHSITHDWTSFESENADQNKMAQSAVKDVEAVKECDVLIAFLTDPQYAYRGTFSEIGIALGTDKEIIVVNSDEQAYCTTNVFYHHPDIIHVKTWDELLPQLEQIKQIYEWAK